MSVYDIDFSQVAGFKQLKEACEACCWTVEVGTMTKEPIVYNASRPISTIYRVRVVAFGRIIAFGVGNSLDDAARAVRKPG